MVFGLLHDSTIAMHNTQGNRGHDAYNERNNEKINNGAYLLGTVVPAHSDRFILPRVIARKGGAEHSVLCGKIRTPNTRRISASLNIDQKHGLVVPGRLAAGFLAVTAELGWLVAAVLFRVLYVDVGATVEVAGAAFAARAPGAVEKAGVVVSSGGNAGDRFRYEVRDQRGDGRIDV